jgi:hypothetical protein
MGMETEAMVDYPSLEEMDPSLGTRQFQLGIWAEFLLTSPKSTEALWHLTMLTDAVDGFQVFYEREVPFELRSASTVDMPNEVRASTTSITVLAASKGSCRTTGPSSTRSSISLCRTGASGGSEQAGAGFSLLRAGGST